MSKVGHHRGMTDRTPSTYGTQRKAAARNRVAIIEAAHELFAHDPLVPLSDVAKRAGVGAGTLYRHFPTREDLILAAYQHDIERLTVTADEVLARASIRRRTRSSSGSRPCRRTSASSTASVTRCTAPRRRS